MARKRANQILNIDLDKYKPNKLPVDFNCNNCGKPFKMGKRAGAAVQARKHRCPDCAYEGMYLV